MPVTRKMGIRRAVAAAAFALVCLLVARAAFPRYEGDEGLHEAECAHGNARSCAAAAKSYESRRYRPRRVRDLLALACEGGAVEVCAEAAARFIEGRGGRRDREAAGRVLAVGCGALNRPSCARLRQYVDESAADDVPPEVIGLLEAACSVGTDEACGRAVASHPRPPPVPAVPPGESGGCSGGAPVACVRAGAVAMSANQVGRARGLFDAGCGVGYSGGARSLSLREYIADACIRSAEAWLQPPEEHFGRAVDRYRRACRRSSADGCLRAGVLLVGPDGPALDEAQSADLLDYGCRLGEPLSCSNLEALQAGRLDEIRASLEAP